MFEAIDISKHNNPEKIQWNQVRAAGFTGVIIRAGWAGYEGELHLDPLLDETIVAASAAGLAVGLYVYAYCKTPAAARQAAQETVQLARRHPGKITYPLALDIEETTDPCLIEQGRMGLSTTVAAWCQETQKLGYYANWYSYTSFVTRYLELAPLTDYDLWIADYRGDAAQMEQQLGRPYGMWQYDVLGTVGVLGQQYQTVGQVAGVPGNCDVNHVYRDYPHLIREAGLNGLTPSTGDGGAETPEEGGTGDIDENPTPAPEDGGAEPPEEGGTGDIDENPTPAPEDGGAETPEEGSTGDTDENPTPSPEDGDTDGDTDSPETTPEEIAPQWLLSLLKMISRWIKSLFEGKQSS